MDSQKMTDLFRSLLLIFTLFLSTASSGQEGGEYKYEVDSYRNIIGLQENDLRKTFGQSRIESFELPLHDPGMYENGLRLSIGQRSIFLRMNNGIVSSLSFYSSVFRTSRGTSVGQEYCDVLSVYPETEFALGYEDGGFLRLLDKERGMVFEFSVDELPLKKYLTEGKPSKGASSLCSAVLSSIELR